MLATVTIPKSLGEGLDNLKANFWLYVIVVIILGVLESLGNGPAFRQNFLNQNFFFFKPSNALIAFIIGFLITPVFEYGARLMFVSGNRREEVDVRDMTEGFNSRDLFIDIVLTNLIVKIMILLGCIALLLPGLFIASRTVMSSYLVIDKGLAPRQAIEASWELTRDYWLMGIGLMIISCFIFIIGLCLLIVGLIPAIALVKAIFASFYQQILDAHDEEFLLSLDIEP